MSPIDDPNAPRFFSKQKDEMDEILTDIDHDLSGDVLDIESFDDAPIEPLKASKSGRFKPTKTTGDFLGKKSSSTLLLGSVLGVLVIGGAGAYMFLGSSAPQPTAPLMPPSAMVTAPPVNADSAIPAPPLIDNAVTDAAGINQNVDPLNAAAATLPALPNENQPPVTVPDSTVPPTTTTNTVNDPQIDNLPQLPNATADTTTSPPSSAATDKSAETTPPPVTEMVSNTPPVPLTPEEKGKIVEPEDKNSGSDKTAATDSANPALKEVTDAKEAVKTDSKTETKTDSNAEAITAQTETDKVTKSAQKPAKIKYFDAPPGEILEDIAPPSIDVSRNPGESIIIVQKPPGFDGYASAGPDESVRIERSRATETQENLAISADRALRLGRYDMALTFYNQILAQNKNDVTALLGRAIAYQKMGQVDQAAKGYRDVLGLDSSNITAATNLAGIQSLQSPTAALKNLSKVYQDDPNNPAVKAQMGVSMAESGDVQAAYDAFLRSTQADPKNPQHLFNLAVTAERLGKRTEAIAAYEKCLEVDAIYGTGRGINRDQIYDRLTKLRGS